MDPKQTPPGGTNSANASASATGINSASASVSATGASVFANPRNRFNPNTATSNVANANSTNPQGDILIPSSTPAKKSNANPLAGLKLSKPLILVIIAAVAIVVMLILTSLINSGSGGVFGGNEISDADLKTAFNRYANYAISGTDSTEDLTGEYESGTEYAITTAVANHDTEYFETAKTYFDNFYDLYEESLESIREAEDAENEDEDARTDSYSYQFDPTYWFVESYRDIFDFFYAYVETPTFTETEIIEKYLELGESGANDYIEQAYAELVATEYEDGQVYTKAAIARYKAMVTMAGALYTAGCINENAEVDNTCVENFDFTSQLNDSTAVFNAASNEDAYLDLTDAEPLAELCWEIEASMNGEYDEDIDTPVPDEYGEDQE